jgi:hypothetical protein
MPAKTYKEYCREALARYPEAYKGMFNPDGSKKEPSGLYTRCDYKIPNDVPKEELRKMEKIDSELLESKPGLEVRGTEIKIKGRRVNLTILPMPENPSQKEYNRVWMNNYRVRERLKRITQLYGTPKSL